MVSFIVSDRLLFYVPQQIERNVSYKYHNELDHLRTEKSAQAILENYWFPKLREKVNCHVKNCLKYIAFSLVSGRVEGLVQLDTKGNVPFDTI
jgi:hypothetical protein